MVCTIFFTLIIILMIWYSNWALGAWDRYLFEDQIIYNKQTQYQKITLTKYKEDIRLYLMVAFNFLQ